jgi:hypothetical protein
MYIQLKKRRTVEFKWTDNTLKQKKKETGIEYKKKQIKVTPETKQTDTYLLNYQEEAIQ